MNLLQDIILYVRRIIKTPSGQVISDAQIVDYVNRFYTQDVALRYQFFDLKTKYNLETTAYIDQYNLPYYPSSTAPDGSTIGAYPMYQGLIQPSYIDGVQIPLTTSRNSFLNPYPNYVTNQTPAQGDGTTGPYAFSVAGFPMIRCHIDVIGQAAITNNVAIPASSINSSVFLSAFDSNNNRLVLQDVPGSVGATTQSDQNVGNLVSQADVQANNITAGSLVVYGTVNYVTGAVSVSFPTAIPSTQTGSGLANMIEMQSVYLNPGIPRMCLFFNNVICLRPMPDKTYLFEADAYLTPAAFLSTSQAAFAFGYMTEYLARGAARKILSDVADVDQFNFYEPLFREQELLVLRRSSRMFTANRVPTIFSELGQQTPANNFGAGT